MKKKVNPNRKPMSNIAKEAIIRNNTLNAAWAIIMTVLIDKEGFNQEDIERVWNEVENLSDSITKGYVNINDLKKTLKDEFMIILE